MRLERSYVVTTSMPGGSALSSDASFALTASIVSSALPPERMTMMPPATSPSQSIRIENDLVLPHHAADARHFGDVRHCLKFVFEKPVLQCTKLREIHVSRAVDERIFVDPPDPRRIRTERCLRLRGKSRLHLVQ